MINYKIHTDAIKEYLLKDLTNEQLSYKYVSEADMINVVLFNKRAKQWREENRNNQYNTCSSCGSKCGCAWMKI